MPPTGNRNAFYFSKETVRALLKQEKTTEKELLIALVQPISQLARPPISEFHVGAAGLGKSGAIYAGINLEFPGVPLGNSVHAEQFMITNAMHHGETELVCIAVNAAPCGHCRQFLSELHNADSLEFLLDEGDGVRSYTTADLLPLRFKPQDVLGEDYASVLMAPRRRRKLQLTAETKLEHSLSIDARLNKAATMALDAASQSYVPYSECPCGVVIVLKNGEMFDGDVVENCAYNPTLPPLQSAIVHAISKGHLSNYTDVISMHRGDEIGGKQKVSHAHAARSMLKAIAPEAKCIVLSVEDDH